MRGADAGRRSRLFLEHAARKDSDAETPPVDFCKNIGGTTITMDECRARDCENAETARALETKKTERTWEAYRDADVAFCAHVFGPKQGEERVRAARRVMLELRRAKECAPPSAGEAPVP